MTQIASVSTRNPFQRVQVLSARWLVVMLALAAAAWLVAGIPIHAKYLVSMLKP
jgi:paraquat-inducible protein B